MVISGQPDGGRKVERPCPMAAGRDRIGRALPPNESSSPPRTRNETGWSKSQDGHPNRRGLNSGNAGAGSVQRMLGRRKYAN